MFPDRSKRCFESDSHRMTEAWHAHSLGGGRLVVQCLSIVCLFMALASPGEERRSRSDDTKAVAVHQKLFQDPCLGIRWTVVADQDHRDRPPRLFAVGTGEPGEAKLEELQRGVEGRKEGDSAENREHARILIHPGDPVLIDQQTPSLHALFQGNALTAAGRGDLVRVRLRFGTGFGSRGTVIVVVATQNGRAEWNAPSEKGL